MKVLVLGATGFLGKHVCKKLDERGIEYVKSSKSLGTDLRDPKQTNALFAEVKPDVVLHCAAFVGGIHFGVHHAAEMFRNNLLMTINIFDACHAHGVTRFVNPISNCAYPGEATLFKEDEFWDGPLHESVLAYGLARKASWVGAWAYNKQYGLDTISIILSNMYGPGDHFDEERSHALGALIMKFVKAKRNNESTVTVWGTGKPVREWLYVEDGAEAMIRAMDIDAHPGIINIGVSEGISIGDMARLIGKHVGYDGEIVFDTTKPDGAKHKTVEGSKGEKLLGWKPEKDFEEGVKETIQWYVEEYT